MYDKLKRGLDYNICLSTFARFLFSQRVIFYVNNTSSWDWESTYGAMQLFHSDPGASL